MADIKRLNYFKSQFLVAQDFIDAQNYQLEMRRRHNRFYHTPGIATGLEVKPVDAQTIRVETGMALDQLGRELVLLDPVLVNLSDTTAFPANSTIYVTIAYQEEPTDPQPPNVPNPRGMTRITERAIVSAKPRTQPPGNDENVVTLANFTLSGNQVPPENQFDHSVRKLVSAQLSDNTVSVKQLKRANFLSGTIRLDEANLFKEVEVFSAAITSGASTFPVIYAFSPTIGAVFKWEQQYRTQGTNLIQVITFFNLSENQLPIDVTYKIYMLLDE